MFWRTVPLCRTPSTKLLLLCLVFVSFLFYFKSTTNEENAIVNGGKVLVSGKLISSYQVNDTPTNGKRQSAWEADGDNDDAHENLRVYNAEFEREIEDDIKRQIPGLGNRGQSAELTNKASIDIGERQLATISLNEELSEHLSYNRTLQDARNPLCRHQHYNIDELPTVSVVIIFFNEPYSVLVRTIHSVLNTCDRRLLKEVIIVDDCSTSVVLKDKLDYYIQTRFPMNIVKTIRLKHR